ncbi:MAG: dihydrodipicolinate synthase family protein [Acidobacteria bacterium]|nr:dihydrodipicolinate synthase family protein [Acidobacteriota bacterium]
MTINRSERKQWARENFKGLQNVLVPSFDSEMDTLSEEGIRLDVRQSIKHGFFSTLCACEAGLSLEENKRFVEIAVSEAAGKMLVGISLFLDTTEQMIELTRHAEKAGCTHALLGYPLFFNPRSEEEIFQFARQICEASNLSIILPVFNDRVDFTRFHPSGVPFGLYDRLTALDTVVAIQIETVEPGMITECFTRYRDQVLVSSTFLGMLPMLNEIYGLQWSGNWIYEALQSPQKPQAVEFFNLLLAKKTDSAMKLFWQMAPTLSTLAQMMGLYSATGADHFHLRKFYQWSVGGNGGLTRQPHMNLYRRQKEAIRSAYRAVGIIPAENDDEFLAGKVNYSNNLSGASARKRR